MTVIIQGDEVRAIAGGIKVEKSSGATAASTTSLFTVSGLVVIEGIIGDVTVAFDGTITSVNLNHNPTVGSAVDLCAATVVTFDVVGTIYGYLGDATTTLMVSSATVAPNTAFAPMPNSRQVLQPGVIGHVGTAADAGTVLWRCVYWPLSDDASVVAA